MIELELKLRGYVTPEDFGGDVQTAIDKAEQLDIRKVVLNGDYTCGTLILPGYTHLVLGGTLKADVHSRKGCGWCDEQDRYFLEGGKLDGNLYRIWSSPAMRPTNSPGICAWSIAPWRALCRLAVAAPMASCSI